MTDRSARSPAEVLPSSLSETEQAIAVARVSDAAFVDVSDGFCTLVGRRRDELLGRTAAELGISHRDRLDWLISRFPERGRSHHQQRVFETRLRPAILHDRGLDRALHVLVAQIARWSRPDAALHFGLDTMIERIRAAGGEAAIDSEVGSGTTVSFTVPLAAPVAHDSR